MCAWYWEGASGSQSKVFRPRIWRGVTASILPMICHPPKGKNVSSVTTTMPCKRILDAQDLARRLRVLSERARSDLRDRGVHTLFAAFGFLEWYEDATSGRSHLAPLVLVPVELERVSRNNRRTYLIRKAGEQPIRNAALAEDLVRRFDLELPDLDPDDTPESYFQKIDSLLGHERRWRIRHFLTIQIFSDAKLAIYADLAPDAWPEGAALSRHRAARQLMSEIGVGDASYSASRVIASNTPPTSRLMGGSIRSGARSPSWKKMSSPSALPSAMLSSGGSPRKIRV